MASSNKYCIFCSNRHSPVNCRTYPTVSVRQDRLNELRRCYRCLKTGHVAPQCVEYVGCGICRRNSHHTALCCKNELTKDAETPRSKNEWCVFCARHYNSSDCKKIRTHKTRINHVFDLNLCFTCLDKCHPAQPCQANSSTCKFCNSKTHHKSLCPRNPQLEENFEANPTSGLCIFCGAHSQPARCNKKDLQFRINTLAVNGRCHKCLRHHSTESCEYRYRCRICRSPNHHGVICPLDPALTRSSVSPVPSSPSIAYPCLNADDDYIGDRQCISQLSVPSSPSSGYCSDDFSEPEFTPALSSMSFDNTWQHPDSMVMQMNGKTAETRQDMPESKLHIWLGAKKRTACTNQNRPTTTDYTFEHLASLMTGCGLPEAPKNSRHNNVPFIYKFY